MKYLLLLSFYLGNSVVAQDLTRINKDLSLPDLLTYDREIRIYRGFGATNYTSIFRLYQNRTTEWRAEFYEHNSKIEGVTNLKTEKWVLKAKGNPEKIWLNFLRSHADVLPTQSDIQWKLADRGEIREINGKLELMANELVFADGIGYLIQLRNEHSRNEFGYSNPESSLEFYPEIDELIYVKEIIDIVRTHFDIWLNRPDWTYILIFHPADATILRLLNLLVTKK